MKTWYIRNNDEHLGPYSLDELKLVGLYSDDYVWKEGLPKWTKANSVLELKELIITVEHSLFAAEKHASMEHDIAPPYAGTVKEDPPPTNFLIEAGKKLSILFRRKRA